MPELILAQIDSGVADFFAQPFVSTAFTVLCLLGLLFIGAVALFIYLRSRGIGLLSGKRPAEEPVSAAQDMPDFAALVTPPVMAAPAVPAPRKGTFTVTPADGPATEAVEVLTVLRDVADGRLLVQMGEKILLNPAKDAAFNVRLQKVLRDLLPAAPLPVKSNSAPAASVPQPAPVVEPPIALVEDEPLPMPDDLLAPISTPRPAAPANRVNAPGVLPSFKLDDVELEKPRRGKKYTPKPVPELNIAGAIETFIQFKRANLGLFPGRSIHIHSAADGGVSIEVDGQYYDSVGEVSDTTVREFLAASIAEWQEQH
jgi:hypothetical protein